MVAILCVVLMVLGGEPLFTDGDWGRHITNDFPLAPPASLAGLALAGYAMGLLQDLRGPVNDDAD